MSHLRSCIAWLCTATLSLGLIGCPESADIATADMRAEVEFKIDDGEAKVEAKLYDGADGSFSIELSEGDRLFASADNHDAIQLEGDTSIYRGTLPVDPGEVRVDLARDAGVEGFLAEQVPDPAVLDTTTFSSSDDPITVTWSNPVDGGRVSIFVDTCATVSIETPETKESVSDTGSYTISRAELESEAGAGADLVIVRSLNSNAPDDGGFNAASYIRVIRYQRQTIQLTP